MRLIYIWIYLVQSEDQSVVFLTASSCVSLYADDLIVSTCVSLAPPPFLSIRTSCFTHGTVCLFECLNHMLFFLLLVFLILCWIFFFFFLMFDIWRHFVFHLLVPHPFSWYLFLFTCFSLTLFTWLSVKPQWVNDQISQRFSSVTNPKTIINLTNVRQPEWKCRCFSLDDVDHVVNFINIVVSPIVKLKTVPQWVLTGRVVDPGGVLRESARGHEVWRSFWSGVNCDFMTA